MNNNLEHAFIRTEADDKYTLFLKIDKSLLEQEVDITLNEKNQLQLLFSDGKILATDTLTPEIYNSLANSKTLIVFTDENAEFIAQETLDPLKPEHLKRKAKP